MENKLSSVVVSQLPSSITSGSDLFGAFVELYYEYLQQRNNAAGVILYHSQETDIDTTQTKYIDNFYAQYGQYIQKDIAIDRRNLIKLLDDVYEAKGTEKALKLVFRALFNEEIALTYPSQNILRASDGIWERESFITVLTLFGDITGTPQIQFKNTYGDYVIDPTHIETVGTELHRIYFKSYNAIRIEDDQEVFSYLPNGVMSFAGRVVKSMERLTIRDPGGSWQVGQVIVIPGSEKDSIARITSINSTGGITGTEILEYGYSHELGQVTTISPYPNKPIGSIVEYNATLVSINPNVYHHTLSIRDFTDGCYETITGISDGISPNSFFLEDYVVPGYSGQMVMSGSSGAGTTNEVSGNDAGITIEEWLASRSALVCTSANVVTSKGYWKNENGQISNQQIRLQDNYFYQAFSYLIETSRNISEYRNILNITHPAGMKSFFNLAKTTDYEVQYETSRVLSNDSIYLLDTVTALSASILKTTKPLTSAATISDSLNSKHVTKVIVDSAVITDSIKRQMAKRISDSVSAISTGVTDLVILPNSSAAYDTGTYFLEEYTLIPNNYTLYIQ